MEEPVFFSVFFFVEIDFSHEHNIASASLGSYHILVRLSKRKPKHDILGGRLQEVCL